MSKLKKLSLVACLLPILIAISTGLLNMRKESNVRILLWESPSISIGLWIILSSSSSAILTYSFISSLTRLDEPLRRKVNINARDIENVNYYSEEEANINSNTFNSQHTDNDFIPERDPRDPAPTIAVPFTIVKRGNKMHTNTGDSFQTSFDAAQLEENDNLDYEMEETDQNDYCYQQVESNTSDDWYEGDLEEW